LREIQYENCEWCGIRGPTLESFVRVTKAGPSCASLQRCYKCKKWFCTECLGKKWDALRENRVIGSAGVKHELALWREGRSEGFFSMTYLNDYCPECGKRLDQGCFIATSALGTPYAWQLDVLRDFRDHILLQSAFGTTLVNNYVRWSPAAASWLDVRPRLRWIVRSLLVSPMAVIIGMLLFKRNNTKN